MQDLKLDKIICSCGCNKIDNTPKYFTQFNVYKNLKLPCTELKEENIEETVAELEVNSAKVIDTIIGISIEGQQLTGKKLVVIGKIITKTIFRCPNNCKKLCVSEKYIPFSTFIIIPDEICKENSIKLRYFIEDVTTAIIKEHKIFISITLLLEYVDE